ncbi:unnamed protein product [Durusdinium trenchii]|uniref:Uncharacterized protein n=1 Tax=Durusdinium trenchii TaxID=1381693 RepID=A0ABP0K5N9_9DINO
MLPVYMGDHGPPYQHMMQLVAPAMNDASPVNQTLTAVTAVSTQAKEEEVEPDDESVAEDKKMEYVYCGIDWKPCLPTVAGAICVFLILHDLGCLVFHHSGLRDVLYPCRTSVADAQWPRHRNSSKRACRNVPTSRFCITVQFAAMTITANG